MKKKINIILIAAVLGLWGTVGYRFISNYFSGGSQTHQLASNNTTLDNIVVKRDTFELQPIRRDPFLNKISGGQNNFVKPRRHVSYTKKPVEVNMPAASFVDWPDIQYFGYIKSSGKKELALIRINGQLYRMHNGETKNNISIQNVYKDSIVIKFNKEKRVYKHM